MTTRPLLLGVDIGTSSAKGVLTSVRGEIIARADRSHTTSNPRPGWFEHDAEAVWWTDFVAITRALLDRVPGAEVVGVGVSGIGPTLLPADDSGTPLRPGILYGVDSRAGEQIARLNDELGAAEIFRRAGSTLTSQAVGPKLLWLRKRVPSVFAKTRMLLMSSSYLVHRLTGRYVLDHHSASQCTPMYDIRARRWDPEWSEHVAPGLPLPELAWPTEIVGVVTREASSLTGIPAGTPVTAGTIDAWAEATSVGVRDPGDVMLMYGTTMFLVQVVRDLTTHPGVWATTGVWPGSYNIAATMPTSGAVTNWMSALTSADFATLVAEAAASPAGANGLLLLPHFAGERTPHFDADARGVIAGLTLGHTRGDIYRAALEGIAFGTRHILATMAEASGRSTPARLVAVGGGTQGGLWTQIVSDVTGLPQQLCRETVGAALGDALVAGVATNAAVDIESWNPTDRLVSPDPATAGRYAARFTDYLGLGEAVRDIAHRLAATQYELTEHE